MKNLINKIVKTRKYNNIVEAAYVSTKTSRISGLSVLSVTCTPGNQVVTKFSKIGLIFYLIWCSSYSYCTYIAYLEHQSIVRSIYKTKLKIYGDTFEWIACIAYVTYGLWKVPFNLSGNRNTLQKIVDIDLLIHDLGVEIDYNKNAYLLNSASFSQFGIYLMRFLCIWVILQNLNVNVPTEKIFQVICSDALALIITTFFCYYLILLRNRFKWINEAMSEIKMRKPWDFKVLVRNKTFANEPKFVLKHRNVCEKVKLCARIYGMLYQATEIANKTYGFALVLTLGIYLIVIVLYMFYFMEATATGLFHDFPRYIDFLILFFWQIAYAVSIIFLNVYFCESVMKEAAKISFTIHEIINGDYEPEIATEAMQFSIQILHQAPVFTASGLFKLNYELLQSGAQTVSTYLIMLLQFAVDKK